MTDWRGRGEGPDQTKLALAAGAAAGLLVLGWMFMARAGEERPSSNGFAFGGPAPLAAPARPASAQPQTSLSMVRFGFTDAPSAARPEAASAGMAPGEAAPSGVEPPPAGGAPAAPPASAGSEKDLAAIGVSPEPRSLSRLGGEKGLLSSVVEKALEHPSALKYLLNNKTLVDAYFSRDLVRSNCSSGSALKSYLMNGSDPQGVSEEITIARALLQHPDAAAAAAGTEFGSRLMNCPSVAEIGKDPGAVVAIAGANPAALGLLSDPNAVKALSSNPQALSLLGAAQSSLGGGGAP
jgi:hypothetical protein